MPQEKKMLGKVSLCKDKGCIDRCNGHGDHKCLFEYRDDITVEYLSNT